MSNLRSANAISTLHPSRIVLYLLAILLIVYVAFRAMCVSITHDEAFTFFYYVNKPWAETLKVTYTNNHFLNSILAKITSSIFGDSEFALRLPNVFGGALFFIFGARLTTRIHSGKWFPVFAFVALTFNPFVLDFFGLCRGYGLSLGLLMVAVYAQYRAFTEKEPLRFEVVALLFSALALLANYTLLNFFLIHAAFIFASATVRIMKSKSDQVRRKFYLKRYIPFAVLTLAFMLQFLSMILRLNENGNFNFGGTAGFWSDTVFSLAIYSCFPILRGNDWISAYVTVAAGFLFVIAFTVTLINIIKGKNSANAKLLVFLATTITGSGTAIFVQHHLLGVPFSMDRTAIYFIPLFTLMIVTLVSLNDRWRLLKYPILAVVFLPMILALLINLNLNSVIFWPRDAHMQEASDIMISDAENAVRKGDHLLVDVPFDVKPTFNYYVYRSNTKAIALCRFDENNLRREADWLMIFADEKGFNLQNEFLEIGEVAGKKILKRNSPVVYTLCANAGEENFEDNGAISRNSAEGFGAGQSDLLHGQQHFSKAISYAIPDSLLSANVFVFTCKVRAEEIPAYVVGVFALKRSAGMVMWRDWGFDQDLRTANQWESVVFRMRPSVPLQSGDTLEFSVINQSSDPVLLDRFKVDVYRTE